MSLTASETATPQKIISLQWLRFAAAMAVMLYHAAVYLDLMNGSRFGMDRIPSNWGAIGVAVFFALSGNLMSVAMMRATAPQFLLHRIGRIYPAFFLVSGLAFAAALVSPIKPPFDLHAMTLFPYGGSSYPLGVEWTLVFEIVFYMFVFLLILFKKTAHASAFLIGWLALILMHNVIAPDNPKVNVFPPLTLPLVSLNVSFAAGMLAPLLLKNIRLHPALALTLAVSFLYVGTVAGVMGVRWGLGIGAALFVFSLSQHRFVWPLPGRQWLHAVGDRLGGYSYALYLCHVPVIRTLYATQPDANPGVLFYSGIALSLILCVPLGELDVRMYRAIKRRVDLAPAWITWGVAGAFTAAFFLVSFWTVIKLN